jgi:tetratricopeptide (TPR) repeat protein
LWGKALAGKEDRIDGWKAIAAFFGRERTTVIRWARERGLPVHALPGGKTRTVYALRSELEAWSRSNADTGPEEAAPPVIPPPEPAKPKPRSGSWIALAAGIAIVLAVIALIWRHGGTAHNAQRGALPSNPAAAALLLQARDDWAQRTAESLTRSISELQRVNRIVPDFAPAYADLADAYLLAGEQGSLPQAVAFDGADHAAARAMKLDPNLAAAHRAQGFILYWWRHDSAGAGLAFREAIRLDPAASQTHFWYANVLADNGQDNEAAREFDKARLADPGSGQIGADYAWALWIAGRDDDATMRLSAIVAQNPANSEALDCLGMIALARGDYRVFLNALHERANLRGEPTLEGRVTALDAAFRRGGGQALLRTALANELSDDRDDAYPDHSQAAFFASLAGDRAALMQTLALADAGHEQWGSAGYVRRIRARWQTDAAVIAALNRRASPPVEPSGRNGARPTGA